MNLPFVTVVMPIRNEVNYIHRSLTAVLNQDYPSEMMEVLIVDGLSDDGTRQVVESYAVQYPHLRCIDNPKGIVPAALNLALGHARGDVILRVDGHCEVAPDYVRQCVVNLQQEGVDGVGGVLDTVGENLVASCIAAAMSSPFGVGNVAFRTGVDKATFVDTVAFPAFPRAVVEEVGLYDEKMKRNEDDEYNYRLLKLGYRLLLTPDVRVKYYCRSSIPALARQYYAYGFWKVQVLNKHPYQMRPRQFVPPIFVLLLLLSTLVSLFARRPRPMLLIFGPYVAANIIASIATGRSAWQRWPLFSLAFATLHLAYGLGFLHGLWHWRRGWS